MNEWLNKYAELREQFVDLMVENNKLHIKFLEKQNTPNSANLKRNYRRMRLLMREIEKAVFNRKLERTKEFLAKYPARNKKMIKEEENE